jgi:hypothetical protein
VDEFLTKDPQAVVYDNTLANQEGIEDLLIGAYAELDGVVDNSNFESAGSNWIWGDVYADDAYKGSEFGDQPAIDYIETYELYPFNYYYLFKWKTVYDGISRCNDVIRVTKLAFEKGNINMTEATGFLAEARFLRAYYHLEAIKMWDFVPYINEDNQDGLVKNQPASSASNSGDMKWGDIGGDGYIPWAEVESDFQFAMENLSFPPRHVARAHHYAAAGLLARTKLFQSKYDSALILLDEIIESGEFQLTDNYHDNFRTSGDNNSESIFQIQASVNDGSGIDYGNSANGNAGDFLNFPIGGGPGNCCGFYQPSQNLVNAFKTTDGSIGGVLAGLPYLNIYGLNFNAAGDDVVNDESINSSDPFTPETRPLDPRLDWTVGRRGIPYLDWGDHPGRDWIRNQDFGGPYNSIKHVYYQEFEGINSTAMGWISGLTANNYSIMRYADVLLMAAECEVEVGSRDRARELVNMVRGRMVDHPENWVKRDNDSLAANYRIVRYPTGDLSDPFQTQEGAREAVQFERRLEFGMEGHRFWDLKRWGMAKSTLNAYLEKESELRQYLRVATFEDKHIRHPIPQDEIDVMEGILKQNPGYY